MLTMPASKCGLQATPPGENVAVELKLFDKMLQYDYHHHINKVDVMREMKNTIVWENGHCIRNK